MTTPTPTVLPGDSQAGTEPERWNDFVLAQDAETIVRSNEQPGPRASFEWPHATGPWDHPSGSIVTDELPARANPLIPLFEPAPTAERFVAATVLGDEDGPAEVWVAYLREGLETVALSRGRTRAAAPDDATITLGWSLWRGKPLYVSPLVDDRQLDPPPAVRLDRTEKVTIRGYPGIMRVYSTRGHGDTYPYRVPSVALNWYEGDVYWFMQSHFLTPDQALRVAGTIRPVETR